MIRWPKTLRLSGVNVPVIYPAQPRSGGENCVGTFTRDSHQIAVKRSLPPGIKYAVLIHEAFHAWYWLHANRPSSERLTEEEAVSMFGAAACNIMQDNPCLREIAAALDGTP